MAHSTRRENHFQLRMLPCSIDFAIARETRRPEIDGYLAGAGCLKCGTPSTRSSSASAPSVGSVFT